MQELKVPDSSVLDWVISRTQHSLNARRPLDEIGATIFFQLVSARYERGSIILTSNKSYGDWGSIFGDPIIATAIKVLTNVGFSGGEFPGGEFSTSVNGLELVRNGSGSPENVVSNYLSAPESSFCTPTNAPPRGRFRSIIGVPIPNAPG